MAYLACQPYRSFVFCMFQKTENNPCVDIKLFACWVIFHAFIVANFKKKYFKNTIKVTSDLGPDQDQSGLNWLQRLSADDKNHRLQIIFKRTSAVDQTTCAAFTMAYTYLELQLMLKLSKGPSYWDDSFEPHSIRFH